MNPYRIAASLIFDRLLWDLSYHSWVSRRKLKSELNKYHGKKAVIVCNGPSLLNTDFSLLDDIFTIGLNKINLLFDDREFRPNCIVSVNPFVIEQNKSFFADCSIPLFLDSKSARNNGIQANPAVTLIHTSDHPSFSGDCSFSLFQGYTVTYVALQLAFHFGFKHVALIGCDHFFETSESPNKTITQRGSDKSHFQRNYFKSGQRWQAPDLHQSETYYKLAKVNFENASRMIFNSTVGGELEIFPRISLQDFLVL